MIDMKTSWDALIATFRDVRKRGSKDVRHFETIRGLSDRIRELVLYDDSPGSKISLVHYTKWKNALDMFNPNDGTPVLRMYNYEQSNDPNEGKIKPPEWEAVERNASWLDEFWKDDPRWVEDMKFGGSTYGCSFSSGSSGVEDDLLYWMLYGNAGQGCSLKISPTRNVGMYKVRYRYEDCSNRDDHEKKEDEQVAAWLRDLIQIGKETVDKAPMSYRDSVGRIVAQGLLQVIYGYYHLVKHVDYRHEKEWRIIRVMPQPGEIRYDTTSGNMIKRYVEGPALKQLLSSASAITIGPTVLNHLVARAGVEHLIKGKHQMMYVAVENSDKAYRQQSSSG